MEANAAGRYARNAAFDFGVARPASCGATHSAPRLSWDAEALRPKMRYGGICFPDLAGGMYQFSTPKYFDSRRVVTLRDAVGSNAEGARGVAGQIHAIS